MRNHTMFKFKLAKPMLVALAACVASVAFSSAVFADDAQAQAQALKEQMRIMQQQMQEMQKKIDALSQQQAAQAAKPAAPPAVAPSVPPAKVGPTVAKEAPAEPKFEKVLK